MNFSALADVAAIGFIIVCGSEMGDWAPFCRRSGYGLFPLVCSHDRRQYRLQKVNTSKTFGHVGDILLSLLGARIHPY